MAKEICISSTPHETRLAILEDDQLAEIYYERENEYTLAGSIYNGRVTRVLPGMQSAFVDVGLERDAFLYVTDFLELEDQEETEELEKAAASGGNLPPREVRHGAPSDSRGGRSAQKAEQKPEQKQEPRPAQDRPAPEKNIKERRLLVESAPEGGDAIVVESASNLEPAGSEQDDSGALGAKRWRGRRRRRGGRGAAGSQEGQAEADDTSRTYIEEIPEAEPQVAPEIHATGIQADRSSSQRRGTVEPAPHIERASEAFSTPIVLPGESLSKYGAASAASTSAEDAAGAASEPAAPVRPASTFKPATLIEAPLEWDGSGLLPGESLSRHISRRHEPALEEQTEPAAEAQSEPRSGSYDALEAASDAPDSVEEQDFFEETTEEAPEANSPGLAEDRLVEEELVEEELTPEDSTEAAIEEKAETAPEPPLAEATPEVPLPAATGDYAIETPIEEPSAEEPVASPVTRQDEVLTETAHDEPPVHESVAAEPDPDATASHNVDPLRPTGFRLFGLGSKKKAEPEAPKPEPKPAPVVAVSAYAPGSGLI